MPLLKTYVALSAACVLLNGCSSQPSNDEHPAKQRDVAPKVAAQRGAKVGIVELFKKLEIGMTRQQVEVLLGAPVRTPLKGPGEDLQVDYLGPEYAERSLLPHESPFAPAGIFVTYRRGILVKKGYNSQWVKEK